MREEIEKLKFERAKLVAERPVRYLKVQKAVIKYGSLVCTVQ